MNVKQQAREIGKAWRVGHIEAGQNVDAASYDQHEDAELSYTIGIAGELCFARKYGLEVDTAVRPFGDGGKDFTVNMNGEDLTIDVKTYLKPCNLLIKEADMHQCADVLVLAKYTDLGEDCRIEFLGWETRDVMRVMPVREFSSLKIPNRYRHSSLLRPMWKLEKIIVSEFM